jgi:hypothetical protein
MIEEWRKIPGFPDQYEVSNTGKARILDHVRGSCRHRQGHELKAKGKRYLLVSMKGKNQLLHRLILKAFKGPPPFPNARCRHMDGVKTHNWPSNLKWGTDTENQNDRFTHGTACEGQKNYRAKLTEADVVQIMKLRGKMTPTEIGDVVGCDRSLVKHVIYGQAWNWLTGLPRKRYRPAAKTTVDKFFQQ